jgi:RHS repeat-associated protein
VHDVRHGFTGHAHDDDLGLIDMRGRVYSPSTRQFLTPDPLGRLGASPYSYVRNNPINWIDPSGFTEEDPEGGWYSGFAGLFGSVPVAAIDMSPSLVSHVVASIAAMDFPNGNDAPNSSGCPNGTGTAPRPCAAPGAAGCTPHPREPPTVRQAPPETLSDRVGRILRLEEPPDEIGPYSIAYHIKHGIVDPTRRWIANEPTVYLDADHNVRTSSVRRDYSHEMAPVLGEITLMVAPGANEFARGANFAGGPAATRELAQQIANVERFPMNFKRTVAVVETAEGPTLVAGGATDLSAAQTALAQKLGLTPVRPMPGVHAEETVIFGAGELGLTPTRGVTTNTICPGRCTPFIEGLGGRVTGTRTFEF